MAGNINIAQLARHCKVSQATVSRVFSGTAAVKPATREKVLLAARELNYAPQQTARKDNIAIIIPEAQAIEPPSWFNGMLATVLMREIYRAGYVARFYEVGDIQLIQPSFTVAAIAMNYHPSDFGYEQLVSLEKPVIALNTEAMNFAHSVCTDHAQGIELAVDYLLARNHRRIGLLNIRAANWGNSERLRGYRECLARNGIALDERLIAGGTDEGRLTEEELASVFAAGATALVCAHEDWTLELQYYLGRLGKRVPEDVSLIAAEIPGLSQWLTPPCTGLNQSVKALADVALEIIAELPRNSGSAPALRHRRLPYELIERDSVRTI